MISTILKFFKALPLLFIAAEPKGFDWRALTMKSWRFFVTNVLILGIAIFVACTSKSEKRSALVREGNYQLHVASTVQTELDMKYKIRLQSTSAAQVQWQQFSSAQRQEVREKLAEFVSAVVQTFEIDVKKGVYLSKKEVLQQQLDVAMALQKSLDRFEGVSS